LRGHTHLVTSVSFSPDGTRIVAGSHDRIVRLWDAGNGEPVGELLRWHTHSALSDEHRIMDPIESTTPMPLNIRNNHFICFSPNSMHALRDTSELMEGASFVLDDDWVVGPQEELLFWVPPASRRSLWSPRTLLVIPRGAEIDLSCMKHGHHWIECREEP
jgi:hypothetical protein